MQKCSDGFMRRLVETIHRYSCFTVEQFKEPDPNDPHRHQIYFPKSNQKDGFPGIDPTTTDLWTDEAWQFALSESTMPPEHAWRVHGFISKDTFYIVWLDSAHALFGGGAEGAH